MNSATRTGGSSASRSWPASSAARRTCSARSLSPQRVIRRSDSTATAPLIFESPRSRSTNSIGTSRTVRPARRVRVTRSVWKT